jgi:hypothetical protein
MLAAVGALAACVAAKTGVQAAQEVTTIAGSGAAGIADGPAQKATFLFPYGVAVAHDGSIYISDRAAQRIRVLTPAGQVRTVAGSGSIAPPGLIVPPGYHDGPALQAQFAGPEGLAIGPDGALYIADAYNHCVRKLANDEVSTVVGKCDRTGVTDGPAGVAMLNNPESLAFDASGNLYIADDGIGLRKLGTDGVLSTIRFKSYTGQSARSVAVVNSPEELVVVGGFDGVVVYHPATGTDAHFSAYTLEWPRAVPNQLAAIDARQFVFADPQAENIRYVRLPAPPFDGAVFTRAIAGGEAEHTSDNAGFANGSRAQARFYDPMGIAIAGNRAIVADGGNRRIREIVLPDLRVSGETGATADQNHYEIALVGDASMFADTIGGDSICAHIETIFNRSRRFSKPVRCRTIEVDSGQQASLDEYIKSAATSEPLNLVILDTQWRRYAASPNTDALRARVQGLLSVLAPLRTKLALVWNYPPQDVAFADAEWVQNGTWDNSLPPSPGLSYGRSLTMEKTLRDLPILQYDLYKDLVTYELRLDAPPLFTPPIGALPNPRGNAFLGDRIATGLLGAGLGLNF